MRFVSPFLLSTLLVLGLPASPAASAQRAPLAAASRVDDLETQSRTVLAFGPRLVGSPGNEQARTYLEGQFRALGYQTRREEFRYRRVADLGSSITIRDGRSREVVQGRAASMSRGGQLTQRLVQVGGNGWSEDFAAARGRIAVVTHSALPPAVLLMNAVAAGAVGLVIVSQDERLLLPRLSGTTRYPVLIVPHSALPALSSGTLATLDVRVKDVEVQAVNLVAFQSTGVRPAVLVGAHMDSVMNAPGANDNLSGTLAVVEVARRAVHTPLSAQAYFVLFDAEEDGLLGSREFVKSNAALLGHLKGMLNFDMIGVNVSPLTAWGQAKLVEVVRAVSATDAHVSSRGGSDHLPFREAGVDTLFFNRGIDHDYHQSTDRVIDLNLVREAADTGWRVAVHLLGWAQH